MDIVLKFVIPAILVVGGAIVALVGKNKYNNGMTLGGILAAVAGCLWFVIGTL